MIVVFTDKFTYDESAIGGIANTVSKYDVLYQYFSALGTPVLVNSSLE